jgi:hypothetical protein
MFLSTSIPVTVYVKVFVNFFVIIIDSGEFDLREFCLTHLKNINSFSVYVILVLILMSLLSQQQATWQGDCR